MSRAYIYPGSNRRKVTKILALCAVAIILLIITVFVTNDKNGINILTEKDSDFGSVWIFEENGQRCMTFIKPPTPIVQSCTVIQNSKLVLHPYAQLFLSTLFLNDDPQRILVIGLGGAISQNALNILLPRTQIDTVEINPVLPRLVEKYFDYKEDVRNKIFIEDAAIFAKNTEANTYDIILIDAFNADYIPPQLLADQFMQDVKKMLTPQGIVAINTFTISKTYEYESDLFKRNFGNYYNLIVNKSRVMVAGKNTLPTIAEITEKSVLWRFRFVEVGANQNALLGLYQDPN